MDSYLKQIAEQFNKDGSIPDGIRKRVAAINSQLKVWGDTGSVRRSFAEKKLGEARREIIEEIRKHRNAEIVGARERIRHAKNTFYNDVEARPYAHLLKQQRASFESSMMTDEEIDAALSPVIAAQPVGAKVEGLDSYQVEAVMREAHRRNLGTVEAARKAFRDSGLSLEAFDMKEIPVLEALAHRLESMPEDVIHVVHERDGERMVVNIDELIDTEPLEELMDPPRRDVW